MCPRRSSSRALKWTSVSPCPSAEDPAADRAQLNQFRAYLNHLVFTGADKKFPARLGVETDHMKPILCPIGSDRLQAGAYTRSLLSST